MNILRGRELILIGLLLAHHISATFASDDPFIGMVAYRANLHSHTEYSDSGPANYGLGQKYLDGTSPYNALNAAKRDGLDIMATTDHGGHLSKEEWEDTKKQVNEINSKNTKFVALHGFEWTGGEGHINIFNSHDRTDVEDFKRELKKLQVGGKSSKTNIAEKEMRKNMQELFSWISGEYSDSLICQFNHPNLYSGTPFEKWYNKSPHILNAQKSIAEIGANDILIAQNGEKVLESFALMELSSHTVETASILKANIPKKVVYIGPEDSYNNTSNVAIWQEALYNGWTVGPSLNEDNHLGGYGRVKVEKKLGLFSGLDNVTGIWSESLSNNSITQAIRKRRVFATEDRNLRLKFWVETPKGQSIPMGSSASVSPGAITFHVEASNGKNTSFPRVELIAIHAKRPIPGPGRKDLPMTYAFGKYTRKIPVDSNFNVICYYVRMELQNGGLAFSAPIWINLTKSSPIPQRSSPPVSVPSRVITPSPQRSPQPVSAPVLVIDRSGSITDQPGVMQQVQNRAAEVVRAIQKNVNQAAVINFSHSGNSILDANFTNDSRLLLNAIQNPSVRSGGTAIYDAVAHAVDVALKRNEKTMMILFTDGKNNSGRNLQSAIEYCKRNSVPVVIIGFFGTEGRDDATLQDLANRTDGFYERNENTNIDEILSRFRFYSTNKRVTQPSRGGRAD